MGKRSHRRRDHRPKDAAPEVVAGALAALAPDELDDAVRNLAAVNPARVADVAAAAFARPAELEAESAELRSMADEIDRILIAHGEPPVDVEED